MSVRIWTGHGNGPAGGLLYIRTSLNKCKDIDGLLQTFKSRTPFFIQLVYFSYTLFLRYSSIVRELQMYPRKLSCAKTLSNMVFIYSYLVFLES